MSRTCKRRQFLHKIAGGALLPLSAALAKQEIVIPQDKREIVSSPPPPWQAKAKRNNSASILPVDPEPVVRIDSEADIAAAVAKINTVGKGTLIWGAGTFRIPDISGTHTALYFANLSEFKMYGMGKNKTILMQDIEPDNAQLQLRLCAFENIGKLDVAELSIDGQREKYITSNSPEKGENTHWQEKGDPAYRLHNNREAMNNIFMRNIGAGRIGNINNISSRGDFVNMANVSNMTIHGCDIANCGRNGITLGGRRGLEWSRNVEIHACQFRSSIDTQMIDLELHGSKTATPSQFNRNLYIHNCLFEAQTPDDDIDQDQFAIVLYAVIDFRVENCDINGPVIVRNGHGALRNNTGGIPQFTMDRYSSAEIEQTRFELVPKLRKANRNVAGILVIRRSDISPLRFTLIDCDISASGLESVVEIHDCPDVAIRNNRFSIQNANNNLLLIARSENMVASISNNPGLDEPKITEDNGKSVLIKAG
jgi:hypothetical protein